MTERKVSPGFDSVWEEVEALRAENARLKNELLLRDTVWLPEKDAEIERLSRRDWGVADNHCVLQEPDEVKQLRADAELGRMVREMADTSGNKTGHGELSSYWRGGKIRWAFLGWPTIHHKDCVFRQDCDTPEEALKGAEE